MGIKQQVHLILLAAVSSLVLVPPQRILVHAAVPYGGHVTNWTAPATKAVTAAEVGLAASEGEFLMESETSQAILNSYYGLADRSKVSGQPTVVCGPKRYGPCIPDANGRRPKICYIYTRECIY